MAPPYGTASYAPYRKVGAIIVAAGEGRRMGGVDKIFLPLARRPLIWHSLKSLHDAPQVETIVLVMSPGNLERGRRLVEESGWHKVTGVFPGGRRRQDSVRLGMERLGDADWVIVHDGARPFIDGYIIATGLTEAAQTGAAVAAVPVKDTIKSADSDLLVAQTLRRDALWVAQTPQIFKRQLLEEAHRRVTDGVTDDAAMVEQIGGQVRIFMGSYANIKVTTPDDLPIAEAIMRTRTTDVS